MRRVCVCVLGWDLDETCVCERHVQGIPGAGNITGFEPELYASSSFLVLTTRLDLRLVHSVKTRPTSSTRFKKCHGISFPIDFHPKRDSHVIF